MEKLKLINLISISLPTIFIFYLTINMLLGLETSYYNLNGFDKVYLNSLLLYLTISFIMAIYLIFLTRLKLKYKTWIKSSATLNIIGAFIFIIFFILSRISYYKCVFNNGPKCSLALSILTSIGLLATGLFLLIGFVLFLIAILRRK